MLQDRFISVVQAKTADQLRNEVLHFTQDLGFERVTAMTVVDQPSGDYEVKPIHNAPANYLALYNDPDRIKRDPVAQHCKRQSVPLVWDQGTYVGASLGDQWEAQAEFGYVTGIALALHLPEGRHFAIGVMRDQALPRDRGELTRLVADVQLFAVYAQEAAFRVLVPPRLQPECPGLTPRELEGLKWTMEGKTAWEVGAILGISERTAVLHINNAMHKLGCVNKHQAVLKALRLGLIH
jgi:DNA-binding CsgD family transcriptional regulator